MLSIPASKGYGRVTTLCFQVVSLLCSRPLPSILFRAPAHLRRFEIGSGFACAGMSGSYHNDPFVAAPAAATDAAAATPAPAAAAARAGALGRLGFPAPLATASNNSGGIQGGISNGQTINFRVAFKPPATIGKDQNTGTHALTPAYLLANTFSFLSAISLCS
jgi:chorismate synthase